MSRITRGEFLGLGGALAGAALTGLDWSSADIQPPVSGLSLEPDLVVMNARVYTCDERAPRAEAFAVTGGRFSAVGSSYHGEKWEQYGDDKLRSMFAHRSFLDAGIPVPGASDYGPGPFEPLMAIESMVTRRDYHGREWGPNQRVTVDDALRIGTINGAYASSEEHLKGSITPGKLADFVMLEQDPHDVPPDTIKDIRIARTVVGGKTMHPKGEA